MHYRGGMSKDGSNSGLQEHININLAERCTLLSAYLHIVKLLQPASDPSGTSLLQGTKNRWNLGETRFSTRFYSFRFAPPPPTEHNELSMLVFETPPAFPVLGMRERSRLWKNCIMPLSKYSYGRACGNVSREMSVTTTSVSSVCGAAGRYCTHASSSKKNTFFFFALPPSVPHTTLPPAGARQRKLNWA